MRVPLRNARLATTLCCRRRLERAEVEFFLAARLPTPSYGGQVAAGGATGA
jgi:hypothetical protein